MLYTTGNFSVEEFWSKRSVEFSGTWFSHVSVCVLSIAFSVVILFGTAGNSLMVYLVLKRPKLKSNRNLIVLNLALCDIMTSIFCIPYTAVRLIMKSWPLGELMCKIVPSLQVVYIFVSIFTIVLIAVDRYRAIVHCNANKHGRSKLIYVFPALWMLSLAMALPMFMFHQVDHVYISSGILLFSSCREKWDSNGRLWFASAILVILLVVPLVVLVTLHGLICRFIHTHIESKPSSSRELHRNRRQLFRQRKNMILLTSIAISFAVMWMPLTLTNLIADVDHEIFIGINFNWLIAICHLLAMSSVCINPIIYGWFNSNFKREIKEMMCKEKECKENDFLLTGVTEFRTSRFRERFSIAVH